MHASCQMEAGRRPCLDPRSSGNSKTYGVPTSPPDAQAKIALFIKRLACLSLLRLFPKIHGKPHGCLADLIAGGPRDLFNVAREKVEHGGETMMALYAPALILIRTSSHTLLSSRSCSAPLMTSISCTFTTTPSLTPHSCNADRRSARRRCPQKR